MSISVFMALSTVFHSINSPDNSPLFRSVLPVLFLPYWSFQLYISLFMKVSLIPDIILCGWLGLNHSPSTAKNFSINLFQLFQLHYSLSPLRVYVRQTASQTQQLVKARVNDASAVSHFPDMKPRSSIRLSPTIRSVATEIHWSRPMKSCIV